MFRNTIANDKRTYRCQHAEVAEHIAKARHLEADYQVKLSGVTIEDIEKCYNHAYICIHDPAKTQLDQAYARKCYAQMLFNLCDKNDNFAMFKAKLKVNAACRGFKYSVIRNESLDEKSMLLIEYVRSLNLKRLIGYKISDGEAIQEAADAIIAIYNERQLPSDEYLVRAYEAKFHCFYAKSDIAQAETYHNLAVHTAQSWNVKYSETGHQIKLDILKLEQLRQKGAPSKILQNYFIEIIEQKFWQIYNAAKQDYQNASAIHKNHHSATRQLKRRMEMLFNLRCIRASIGIADEKGRTPMNYIRSQALKHIENSYDRNVVIQAVRSLAKTYQDNRGIMTLSHPYFGTEDLPCFKIPAQKAEILLDTDFQTSISLGEDSLFAMRHANNTRPANTAEIEDKNALLPNDFPEDHPAFV